METVAKEEEEPWKKYANKHWTKVQETNGSLEELISDLDGKLNKVLAKQEYEYLKGYNIYIKRKEKELKELI